MAQKHFRKALPSNLDVMFLRIQRDALCPRLLGYRAECEPWSTRLLLKSTALEAILAVVRWSRGGIVLDAHARLGGTCVPGGTSGDCHG